MGRRQWQRGEGSWAGGSILRRLRHERAGQHGEGPGLAGSQRGPLGGQLVGGAQLVQQGGGQGLRERGGSRETRGVS